MYQSVLSTQRQPGNTNRLLCTWALNPWKPRRMSVTPAAIQILVAAGSEITRGGS